MKVLHVISSLEIGGAQRLLSDLLPIQKERGIDVSLLVNEYVDNALSRKVEESGIPIISLEQKNYKSLRNIPAIRRVIRNYDIVHVHLFPSLYWVALASIGLKRPRLVWTEHSTSNQRRNKWYFRPIEKWIYSRYHAIISISEQTQEALQQWLQRKDEQFYTVNNGIDIAAFTNVSASIHKNRLIMVSRFVPAKDQETVIRAMKYIKKEAIIRFVGDGETLSRCQVLSKEEGVADRIEFMGSRSDIAQLIAESYIGIQSSHWEGFGLTAIEMMAAGKPVVASDVNGLKQVVENAGEIFESGNFKQLASIVNHLLADDKHYRLISERCTLRAQQYDIRNTTNAYSKIYNLILSDGK